ncbi:TerD domain-containing protein [Paenibacillus polysaccharolyticus]|uniref:TerD family protein n=1 Tax=Paenibacillus cucumis (ex Kampfer et al. 2016) TaxID=1776858 RepID=A0ABS7KKJ2_9BACL|nr:MULTISPECIES: TerD family protein [Paenibacillus]MBY0204650.1 TerD family protein [Paenibacillus cucumis (ex Kampfer et al. 2016)]MCP1135768.1 TerD domain-containing protein [Paenibacillus polysaccharolyticus]MDP9702269.1 tellurite resistance protein TerA [Paenibacillus intestini]
MAVTVVKGQKTDLTKTNPGLTRLTVGIGWDSSPALELDTSAFLLGASGKVSGDEDFIFYNQPTGGFITYKDTPQQSDKKQFDIDLSQIPARIEKIAFSLTIYEGESKNQSFSQVQNTYIRFGHANSGQEALRYDLASGFTVETAIVIGELYRHNGEWKFNAVGAGFSGGLDALCSNFGVSVENDTTSSQPVPPVPQPPAPKPPAPPVPPPQPKIELNLSKIELKKKGDTINLKKNAGGLGEILINLNWNQQTSKGLFGRNKSVDLDLGCLFEMKDGSKGVIQALGESFGSLNRYPYIALDGDDRTGSVKTGENLRINGARISEIKRLLVFTYIYEGVTNWSQADGVVTINQKDGPDIIVRMNEYGSSLGMCGIAMFSNVNDETFSIERIVQFYNGHRALDEAHGWGMRWTAGSK